MDDSERRNSWGMATIWGILFLLIVLVVIFLLPVLPSIAG
jgi:t-SNARE complex subunit (syntaxin)